jgi:hypothetical protein
MRLISRLRIYDLLNIGTLKKTKFPTWSGICLIESQTQSVTLNSDEEEYYEYI